MKKDKITLSEIIDIILEKQKDQDGDGKNTFRDVMIARFKASGMSHEEAVEKAMNMKIKKVKFKNHTLYAHVLGMSTCLILRG